MESDIKIFEFDDKEIIPITDGFLDLFYRVVNNRKYEITEIIAGCNEPKIGLKWLDLIQDPSINFDRVYGAVKFLFINELISGKSNIKISEFTLHDLFKEHLSEVIPGAKIAKVKIKQSHIPDAFIQFGKNKPFPVEIKRDNFDQKALNQLNRYCKAYNSTRAVAVGEECTVKLPSKFIFVSNQELLSFKELDDEEYPYGDSPFECLEKIKSELAIGILMDKSENRTEFVHTLMRVPIKTITPKILSEIFLTLFEQVLKSNEVIS